MRKNGFSLIELLISASLILFLISGTVQLLGLSVAAKRNAEFHFRAARLVSTRLEVLKACPYEGADLEAGAHAENLVDPSSGEQYRLAWTVEDLDENLKKVVLELAPATDSRKKSAFCLLMCREMEF